MAKVGIFVGTVHGNSILVAEKAETILLEQGHQAMIYQNPQLSDWIKYKDGYILLITSTTGQGELPSNIIPLFKSLKERFCIQMNIQYGIIALGDSTYTNFCGAGKQFDAMLQEKNANRLGEILLIDDSINSDPENVSDPWIKNWITLLS